MYSTPFGSGEKVSKTFDALGGLNFSSVDSCSSHIRPRTLAGAADLKPLSMLPPPFRYRFRSWVNTSSRDLCRRRKVKTVLKFMSKSYLTKGDVLLMARVEVRWAEKTAISMMPQRKWV